MVKCFKSLQNDIDVKNIVFLNVSWYTDHQNVLQLTAVHCATTGQGNMTV